MAHVLAGVAVAAGALASGTTRLPLGEFTAADTVASLCPIANERRGVVCAADGNVDAFAEVADSSARFTRRRAGTLATIPVDAEPVHTLVGSGTCLPIVFPARTIAVASRIADTRQRRIGVRLSHWNKRTRAGGQRRQIARAARRVAGAFATNTVGADIADAFVIRDARFAIGLFAVAEPVTHVVVTHGARRSRHFRVMSRDGVGIARIASAGIAVVDTVVHIDACHLVA